MTEKESARSPEMIELALLGRRCQVFKPRKLRGWGRWRKRVLLAARDFCLF